MFPTAMWCINSNQCKEGAKEEEKYDIVKLKTWGKQP